MNKSLIYIDIDKDKCLFYDISLEKEKLEYAIITKSGRLGNKGVCTILFSNTDYTKVKDYYISKVNEKKSEGFREREGVEDALNKLFRIPVYRCAICKKKMEKEFYEKVNRYLRFETAVDKDPENAAYKKVICIDCQKKYKVTPLKSKQE